MINYFVYYLIFINFLSFTLMGLDKWFSIKKKRRISEFSLLLVSFIGGSIGEMFGILIFRHKTKHLKFILLNPLFLLIWILIMIIVT